MSDHFEPRPTEVRDVRPLRLSRHPWLTLISGVLVGVAAPPVVLLTAWGDGWEALKLSVWTASALAFLWWVWS